jgi:hypothetical protein
MCKEKLIIGLMVTQQMSKARDILKNQVLLREKQGQRGKKRS